MYNIRYRNYRITKALGRAITVRTTGHVGKSWQLHDDMGKLIEHQDYLVKPDGFMMGAKFTVFH
jgi:hypothetical protein